MDTSERVAPDNPRFHGQLAHVRDSMTNARGMADLPARGLYHRAFNRTLELDLATLERAVPIFGRVDRLQRKLQHGREPITIAAIGSSNVVRGGCEAWHNRSQGWKCAHPNYSSRSADGSAKGWLLQAFEAINRTWPHPRSRLHNRALMATGPSGFDGCVNRFVPLDTDVVLLGFADVCNPAVDLPLYNSSFGLALETLVRELAGRNDPPTILFWNFHKFTAWSCTLPRGLCAFWMGCEAQIQELAQYYTASVISMRNAMFHQGTFGDESLSPSPKRSSPRDFRRWTSDKGTHFDLNLGDRFGAEVLFHWFRRVAREPRHAAMVEEVEEVEEAEAREDTAEEIPAAVEESRARDNQTREERGRPRKPMEDARPSTSGGLPRTYYSTRTCLRDGDRRPMPCLYDATHPPNGLGSSTSSNGAAGAGNGTGTGAGAGGANAAAVPDPMGGITQGRAWETRWGRPPMTCFSFDMPLGGILAPPRVVSAEGWAYVTHEASPYSGEQKPKPGYQTTTRNATLRLSTEAVGEQEFTVGYLGVRRSKAVVRLRCVDGCQCAELRLSPAAKKPANDPTLTTDFSPRHAASAPLAGGQPCTLELVLIEGADGERFKLVALHVRSAAASRR